MPRGPCLQLIPRGTLRQVAGWCRLASPVARARRVLPGGLFRLPPRLSSAKSRCGCSWNVLAAAPAPEASISTPCVTHGVRTPVKIRNVTWKSAALRPRSGLDLMRWPIDLSRVAGSTPRAECMEWPCAGKRRKTGRWGRPERAAAPGTSWRLRCWRDPPFPLHA